MAQNKPDSSREQIPGTYPPEWLPDHDANSCISCDSLFTLIRRRHHCRSCGKIFCSECCRQRAKLLYLGNKEARVCNNCYHLLETASQLSQADDTNLDSEPIVDDESNSVAGSVLNQTRVQGVLKTSEQPNISNARDNSIISTQDNQHSNKQVMFSDGIRPGTDLSESNGFSNPNLPSSSSPSSSSNINNSTSTADISILTRQSKNINSQPSSSKSTSSSSNSRKGKNSKSVVVCDEIGYLPPIVVNKSSVTMSRKVVSNELKSSQKDNDVYSTQKHACTSTEDCPSNSMMRFEEISGFANGAGIITFLLLKEFYLKVKIVRFPEGQSDKTEEQSDYDQTGIDKQDHQEFWCFASNGLARLGQSEIVLVLDKDLGVLTIPRDVFKIYLTIHELALRRQSFENLGNLLFQDGLFGNRETAGLLLVRHMECQDLSNLVLPDKPFLVALVLQRWEVPWSKVFPVRLLLRLGHKLGHYPYPLVSYRVRTPVYYEVGHTIISILGDFRNFRYCITHVEGLKVILLKSEKRILVQLNQSCYQQFNKVLDSASNEHVLAWSAYPFDEADGHLVAVQNDDGNYETVEFYKKISNDMISFENLEMGNVLGASFVIFSGALKANQSGQAAKISVVEDGLLIQLQSSTMSALKQAIHCMEQFDIDCENSQDLWNKVNISWLSQDEQ